ncbi:hypothetical protein Ae168Ps1_0043 [Pseudonocardia sp. Ae168_Ps1]|nr:hypothetical protein FRP1_13580 [Pseudonocardia sp. EC080625-04]ALL77210.1 hypothetical protein AD006_21255 [Pseudonocardia sp. EC080610-09]ALL80125.1 hypothetical protein AD017_00835 [Pseudonocardia sp. EC080619-01]OLL71662.1 hypothetical protein Ae150APs1_0040 [Pseudonocardia sp. Ae150A_Ps1]OLL77637.1 hypothetical protein Ae168Ps1_0043 [Pseudonocardia sp. Ae168_Ps1]OLL88239.1 hypothetical protein Ae263Ps1_5294c [Pseudonocardia sp. Ae263_Ps1]OLL91729.1 hypothetical protein Ae356Ps1_1626 [
MVVAGSVATLLAVSPMAFAADGGIDKDADGLIAGLNGNNVDVPVQVCNNNVPVNVLGVQVPVEDAAAGNGLTGALGILGDAKSKSGDSVTDQSDNCAQAGGAGDSVD